MIAIEDVSETKLENNEFSLKMKEIGIDLTKIQESSVFEIDEEQKTIKLGDDILLSQDEIDFETRRQIYEFFLPERKDSNVESACDLDELFQTAEKKPDAHLKESATQDISSTPKFDIYQANSEPLAGGQNTTPSRISEYKERKLGDLSSEMIQSDKKINDINVSIYDVTNNTLQNSELFLDPSIDVDNCLMIDELDELNELEISNLSQRRNSKNFSKNNESDSQPIELTEEMIENYFKALQQVTLNKVQVQIDDISEMSKEESEITSVIGSIFKEECEMKTMKSQLDSDTFLNLTKVKSSVEITEKLQQMGLIQGAAQPLSRQQSQTTYVRNQSIKKIIEEKKLIDGQEANSIVFIQNNSLSSANNHQLQEA